MATAYVSPPMLRLKRSGQSASYAMAAAWAVVYTESSIMAYLFSGAIIDLSTMLAGDTIDIRVRKQLVSGGAWIAHDLMTYTGAMPAGHQTVHIAPIPDVWGVEIAMRQTAGTLRTIDAEFYDAKRIGLQ
jgi:hypothetical protein